MPRNRPRLWESFKRALGSSPPENEREPEIAQSPREAPPFLAPDDPSGPPAIQDVAPTAEIEPSRELSPEPGIAETSIGHSPPGMAPPEEPDPRSARLARGLASFSRDNADREKKFRHILSDGDAGGTKKR